MSKTRKMNRLLMITGLVTLMMSFTFTASAAKGNAEVERSAAQTVKGKIVDENNEPMIGVLVSVKGANKRVITDNSGNYSVSAESGDVLEFAFIGYQKQSVSVDSKSVIDLKMEPESTSLNEVVAIGYGTVKKRDLTGAVSSVKAKDITMSPVTNPVEALQGRVAGLDIARESGKADAGSSVLMRGTRSLEKGDNPIYIIDGIQGSITNLNPSDIASIDILKDASSTAIYGSAGANGVIIVTTKQAEKGKIQVDFNAYVGVNGWASYPSALQGDAWLAYLEEGYYATNGTHSTSQDQLLTAWNLSPTVLSSYISAGKWVDWVDETLQTGSQQNYTLGLRGGSEKVQSSFSLGYNRTDGIYKNDFSDKFTMRGSVNLVPSKWLKAGIQTGLIYKNGQSRGSRINKAFGTVPLGDVYNESGEINQYPIDGMTVVSLLADDIDGTYTNNSKSINITANPYAEFTLAKGLTVKSVLGTTLSAGRTGVYNSDHTYMMLVGSSTALSNATYSTSLGYSYTWENIANYHFKVAEDHDFGATLISSYSNSQSETSSAYNEGLLYDDFLYYSLSAGTNPSVASSYTGSKMMSFAGRVNYSFQGKYLLTGSVRYDGASELAQQWDVFPAGAFAWRISDEDFMENTKGWLSNLKLRTGYGVSGNAGSAKPYGSKSGVTSGSDLINLGGGALTTSIPTQTVGNAALRWEKSYNLNVGLDFGLFNGRIDGTIELYDTDTKDVIYNRSIPYSDGGYTAKLAYTMAANIARTHNKGVEISLNTRNIETKDFKWTSNITFARNWEEVKSIDLGSATTVDNLTSLGLFMGSPIGVWYDYKKTGIWQSNEAADAAVFGLLPGDVKVATTLTRKEEGVWVKTAEDGTVTEYTSTNPYAINAADKQILGQKTPKWTAGFQNTFTYKNFDLSVFATARWGQTINGALLGYFSYGSLNLPDNYDYWTEDNPTNDFPRPYMTTRSTISSSTLGLTYVDGSYVKIKNITLGYTLPRTIQKKVGLSDLRIYGTLYNPIIITKSHLLNGVDPETGASDSYPLYKQLVFGINMSF
jgi:TonB-linked SusC/RagA family outer membrane protein